MKKKSKKKKSKKEARLFRENLGPSDWLSLSKNSYDFFLRYDSIILFIGLFIAYNTVSGVGLISGDIAPATFLPISLLTDHNLFFDWATSYYSSPDFAYAFPFVNGHYVSLFPIVTPILITPIYGISFYLSNLFSVSMGVKEICILAKSSASIVAALAGVIFYLTGKKIFSRKIAIFTTFIFAFATSTLSISSQALWQHGIAELFLITMVYLIVKNDRKEWWGYVFLLGVLSGLYIFNRPPDFILLIPVLIFVAIYQRSKIYYFLTGGIISGLPFLYYNISIFGNIFGGYATNLTLFTLSMKFTQNFIGMLFAPNVGLFIFCPILLLSILGYVNVYNSVDSKIKTLLLLFGPIIILQILMYCLFFWVSSVFCYGPRYLTDFIPILSLYTGFFLADWFGPANIRQSNQKKLIVTIIIWGFVISSVFIQFIGVFLYPWSSNQNQTVNADRAWNWSDSIIMNSIVLGSKEMPGIFVFTLPPLPPLGEYLFHQASPKG